MKYFTLTFALALGLYASSANSQTFTTLVTFTGTSGTATGAGPRGSLTLSGTTLYGMTSENSDVVGGSPYGNIFSVGINGTNFQNLLSFTGSGGAASGDQPSGSLTLSGTTLYGTTEFGGAKYLGNIFSVGTNGTNYKSLVSFTSTSGSASGNYPNGGLTLSGTTLYGMTYQGGLNAIGSIFSVGSDGTSFKSLISFTVSGGSANGTLPDGSLTLSGTTLYGMTSQGGGEGNGFGNIFSVGVNGTNYQNLVNFTGTSGTASGNYPNGSLTLSGTTLYGMTSEGPGSSPEGNIFSVGVNGTNYRNLVSFTGSSGTATGLEPHGSLTLSGTTLYGMTEYGGADEAGNIFSVGIDGSNFQDLYDFTGGTGGVGYPFGDLTLSGGTLFGMAAGGLAAALGNGDGIVFALTLPATPTPEPGTLALVVAAVALVSYRWRRVRGVLARGTLVVCVALCASSADAQTFKTLVAFTGTSGTATGANPDGSLTLSGSTLYGMTLKGGAGGFNGFGTVFSVSTGGANYKNLATFTGSGGSANGQSPAGSLTLSGSTLYGMTSAGGGDFGNIFSVGTNGSNYQNVLSFTGYNGAANGYSPSGNLILNDATLYGMTSMGGGYGHGNVFSASTGGTNYQNLVSFSTSNGTTNGESPNGSLAISGTTLYGMTQNGGTDEAGNIFSVGITGASYRNLVSFTYTGGPASGQYPRGSLIVSGATLYGMTEKGGANGYGNIFSAGTDGTNFQNLVSFTGTGGTASGSNPSGSLILNGSTLYGMTAYGGTSGDGNIFSVGIDGTGYDDLYNFADGLDGGFPEGDLTLSGGMLFGMTNSGGANGDGTIFALALPASTPEPGTLSLVAAAAVALVSYRWRRMREGSGGGSQGMRDLSGL